jgi:hypothetical protein
MARKPDAAYRRAQSRLVKGAADKYQKPDWGTEKAAVRKAYDQALRQTMPVDGKGPK